MNTQDWMKRLFGFPQALFSKQIIQFIKFSVIIVLILYFSFAFCVTLFFVFANKYVINKIKHIWQRRWFYAQKKDPNTWLGQNWYFWVAVSSFVITHYHLTTWHNQTKLTKRSSDIGINADFLGQRRPKMSDLSQTRIFLKNTWQTFFSFLDSYHCDKFLEKLLNRFWEQVVTDVRTDGQTSMNL